MRAQLTVVVIGIFQGSLDSEAILPLSSFSGYMQPICFPRPYALVALTAKECKVPSLHQDRVHSQPTECINTVGSSHQCRALCDRTSRSSNISPQRLQPTLAGITRCFPVASMDASARQGIEQLQLWKPCPCTSIGPFPSYRPGRSHWQPLNKHDALSPARYMRCLTSREHSHLPPAPSGHVLRYWALHTLHFCPAYENTKL